MKASPVTRDRKSTRLNSSHLGISYAVFCVTSGDQRDLHSFPIRRSSDLTLPAHLMKELVFLDERGQAFHEGLAGHSCSIDDVLVVDRLQSRERRHHGEL